MIFSRFFLAWMLVVTLVVSVLLDIRIDFAPRAYVDMTPVGRFRLELGACALKIRVLRFRTPDVVKKGYLHLSVNLPWQGPLETLEVSGFSHGSLRPWSFLDCRRWSGKYWYGFGSRSISQRNESETLGTPGLLVWGAEEYQVPLWPAAIFLTLSLLWKLSARVRHRNSKMTTQCRACSYDLRGSLASSICPECGTGISEEQKERIRAISSGVGNN